MSSRLVIIIVVLFAQLNCAIARDSLKIVSEITNKYYPDYFAATEKDYETLYKSADVNTKILEADFKRDKVDDIAFIIIGKNIESDTEWQNKKVSFRKFRIVVCHGSIVGNYECQIIYESIEAYPLQKYIYARHNNPGNCIYPDSDDKNYTTIWFEPYLGNIF